MDYPSPDIVQAEASDPMKSVWVTASAGTGKTTVLVARILRLLLKGADPERILCITYTRAAAAEMQHRLMHHSQQWMQLDDAALYQSLEHLGEKTPSPDMLQAARGLFWRLTAARKGVVMQTIHALCQDMLVQFPLEADILPHSQLVDQMEAERLWKQCRLMQQRAIARMQPDEPMAAAQRRLMIGFDKNLENLVQTAMAKRHAVVLGEVDGLDLRQKLAACIGLDKDYVTIHDKAGVIEHLLADDAPDSDGLRRWLDFLRTKDNSRVNKAKEAAQDYLQSNRITGRLLDGWMRLFVKSDGKPFTSVPGGGKLPNWPDFHIWYAQEQERALRYQQTLKAWGLLQEGLDFHLLMVDLAQRHQQLQQQMGLMDYDDVVRHTLSLLQKEEMAWVRYKLDGGFDFILLDEAQDTSPEQWKIIEILVEGLVHHPQAHGLMIPRSLFVVGDVKQSIYRFQGADAANYLAQKNLLKQMHQAAGLQFKELDFNHNFRSFSSILAFVDGVCGHADLAEAMGHEALRHIHVRASHRGRVEVWPLVSEASAKESPNAYPRYIAQKVKTWLDDGLWLSHQERAVQAGDIMILLQKRGDLAPAILQALHQLGVPVAGRDRLDVMGHLAGCDLRVAAEWAVYVDDDMALAILLRSPLVGMDDDGLHKLAYGRGDASLWQRVRQMQPAIAARLQPLIDRAVAGDVVAFYHHLLEHMGLRQALMQQLGAEVVDICHEWMRMADDYMQQHSPSLHGFLEHMRLVTNDIKAEHGQNPNAVRVMTLHGAKGLQAPVVILPDMAVMAEGGQKNARIGVFNGVMLPQLSKSKSGMMREYLEQEDKKAREEKYRLAYVGFTRAEELLCIGGIQKRNDKAKIASSIYGIARDWLSTHGISHAFDWQTDGLDCGEYEGEPAYGRLLTYGDCLPVCEAAPQMQQPVIAASLPDWVCDTPKSDALQPERVRAAFQPDKAREGEFVHAMLEYLPSIPAGQHYAVIHYLMRRFGMVDYPHQAVGQVQKLLDDAALAWVWQAEAMPELPIMGKNGRKRIDRLVKYQGNYHVIDYKTGARKAEAASYVAYVQQVQEYMREVALIWPDCTVRGHILWVEDGALEEITMVAVDLGV